MTKMHFIALARELHLVMPAYGEDMTMWHRSVTAVIRACKLFNPLFNAERFRLACLTGK